ncbi:hypothetical protein L484_000815 [Morus notabilis]|uniref:Uncharacterized protein n=1 Tax=Morus notabilis TaxID=981085 RepID=W9RS99_9ROSA|nr:hypothetical protein L484_000815 [Morus notabilis]
MKLIWVLPENSGQNSIFRPNRVKPRVNRSTGDRAVQHYRSTSSVHTGRLVSLQSGQPDWSTGFHVIRSTGEISCAREAHKNQSKNLQIQSQIEIFQRKTTRSGF